MFGLTPEETARRKAEKAAFDALPLVEQNAIKLTALEREWSALGPLRVITFTVGFIEESEAIALAKAAKDNGFNIEISNWVNETYQYKVQATRKMEPSAQEVTRWETWFAEQASNVPESETDDGCPWEGAEFEGWSYPERFSPAFLIGGNYKNRKHQHSQGSMQRTRILFGETLCKFEASNGWADKRGASRTGLFQLVPSEFIKLAKHRRPENPEPTASGFSQWLYSLYSSAYGKEEDMARGKSMEQYILAERNRAFAATDYQTMRDSFPGWRLKHNGMNMPEDGRRRYFKIEDLEVAGQALRILPDLIYENTNTGAIIVVEVKHSYMTIPENLWPNIWGQLWCYSQMTEVLAASRVTAIGEVWGDKTYSRGEHRYVYLRASVRRDPRAPAFDRFFRALFDIYRGV